jgi:Outer membrane protein beta-barrel domain
MRKLWFCRPWSCLSMSCLSMSCLSMFFCVPIARGQSAIDFAVGGGTATDTTNKAGIDNALSANAGNPCTPNAAVDPFCQTTPGMGGFFLGFSGDIMFKEHFGAGAEVNFQPAHLDYGLFKYRETFLDVNGIYEPITKKRAILQLQGGIGTARTAFTYSQNCAGVAVCSSASQPVSSSTHFQVHAGVGVQIAITDHIFIRPQFDVHYVPNLTDQFGRNVVPEYTVWLGYHFGER